MINNRKNQMENNPLHRRLTFFSKETDESTIKWQTI